MEGSFEGWVRKIMVNKAIEAYHHSSRLQPLIDINDVGDNFVSEEDILSNIAAKDLLRMIQELPPVYKMVFNLHVFEKMTHKEIAAQLGIAEGTSKSNLSDAKTLLKKKINKSMTVLQKRAF
jgi:RNA polymerase sigma-70 factor (ECF subfamily)